MNTSRSVVRWWRWVLVLNAVLAMSGTAQVIALDPETQPCPSPDVPAGYGVFGVVKTTAYTQVPGAEPREGEAPSSSARFVLEAPDGFRIAEPRVAGPAAFKVSLAGTTDGPMEATLSQPTEAALNTAVSGGSYVAQYLLAPTNGVSFAGFFPFSLGVSVPPVPRFVNAEAAQSVAATASFRVEWEPWTAAPAGARVALTVEGPGGVRLLEVDSACVEGASLLPGTGAYEIPAGLLAPGAAYTVTVAYAAPILTSTDARTRFVMRGYQARATRLTLRTAASAVQEVGTITDVRLSDGRVFMTVAGTPRTNYWVQSSLDGTTWTNVVRVALNISGRSTISVVAPEDGLARQYRAVLETPETPGVVVTAPATLTLARVGTAQVRLTMQGTPGGTYRVEWSTNWVTWQSLFGQGITLPRRPPGGGVIIGPGFGEGQLSINVPFVRTPGARVYRAVGVRNP